MSEKDVEEPKNDGCEDANLPMSGAFIIFGSINMNTTPVGSTTAPSLAFCDPTNFALSSTITIGPKKNSEQSEEKIHRTEEVKSFIQQLGIEDFPQGRFKHAIDLYREALSCYENGDFMASTIMCRISMESMIFLCNANFQKSQDGMNYQLDLDSTKRNNSGDLKNSLYSENIKVARDEGYLNEDVCKWLSADLDPNDKEVGIIRHSGDFVAHYSEKLVKDLDLQQRSAVPVNLWIDQKRAHDILSKTCIALKSTNNNYKSINGI